MESSIYRYILRNTRRDQIILILVTLCSFPFVYWSLDVPKTIVNQAIGGEDIPSTVFGLPVSQVGFLWFMCLLFIVLVLINGLFKYYLNVYRGVVGERLLHRFRSQLYDHLLRFPLPFFKRTSSAQLIPMITSETESLGGFIGEAFALPAFQGGLLLTYLYFIFMQDVFLGLAAIVLYPPQLWLIPRLQRKVNRLARRRVQTVRELADTVGETVAGISEIHSNATAGYEKARTRSLLDRILSIRFEIYRRKFFIKFLNNFLAQLTPFMFYLIGGYLVIVNQLSLGALVAVLAAYKDLASPWKELLKYYQTKEDARIKYGQIVEQFHLPPDSLAGSDDVDQLDFTKLGDTIIASNLEYSEDDAIRKIEASSFRLPVTQHTAVIGRSGSGKEHLAPLLARLVAPSKGQIRVGETNIEAVSRATYGNWSAYVGPAAHTFTGTIEENLFYGLRQAPLQAYADTPASGESPRWFGNSDDIETAFDVNATDPQWIRFDAANVPDYDGLQQLALKMTDVTDFRQDAFHFGLNTSLESHDSTDLPQTLLRARQELRQRLAEPEFAELVQHLDRDSYNLNLSVAANLLFGTPLGEQWKTAALSTNTVIREILDELSITEDLIDIGHRLTRIMLEMFADVPPESELFQRFSFISADDLPEYELLLKSIDSNGIESLDAEDRSRLLSMPFTLTVARHRLGLIDAPMQEKIVNARKRLIEKLGQDNAFVQFYDRADYSPAMSVLDNILFGKVAYGVARAQDRVAELIGSTLDDLKLRDDIERLGFRHHAGTAGARLTSIQRQKVVITRALMKQPQLLILDQATGVFDHVEETRMIEALRRHQKDRGLICVLDRPKLAAKFDQVLVMDGGRVVEQGEFEQLRAQGDSELNRLLGES